MNDETGPLIMDAVEARVLGSLVEKELTTPDYYPLSLNALVNACNQTSNRDPVTAYDEPAVKRALETLRRKRLVFVFEGAASRVTKYGHKFAEALGLSQPEVAVLCVLLLRGSQTVGEIRGRTGRLYEFADLGAVEATLQALAARTPQPLVARLARQPGYKESRYAQLLSETPAPAAPDLSVLPAEAPGPTVEERLIRLEEEVAALRRELAEARAQLAGLTRPHE